ncbi:hypothetical protein ABT354_03645 [Streptomyces sp. NPDC000594]|uniref:hypothetical protein n=1 Tax=Streptomyces sp. NPDC000594 TaxID=3154261 RepID=UPI00332694C0
MKPLRTALADALHLGAVGRTGGRGAPRTPRPRGAGCARTDCPLTEGPATGPGTAGAAGLRRGPAATGAARRSRAGQGCERDPLFEFLRSLHQFLTAPQDTAGSGDPGERPGPR